MPESSSPVFVKSLRIENFKSFLNFKTDFEEDINVLVGVNNAGKSTVLLGVRSCFNFIAELIKERKKKLEKGSSRAAVDIDHLNLPHAKDAWYKKKQWAQRGKIIPVIFDIEFSNGIKLEIHLRQFYGQPHIKIMNSGVNLSRDDVAKILESNPILVPGFVGALVVEEYVTAQSVNRIIETGRHAEVLRNVLLKLKESSADRFAILDEIIEEYFGVKLSTISFNEQVDEFVTTDYKEKDTELDIVLAGSGFLQLLQLLAFILSKKSNIVLLDEPDAHLHPSLQKILISILTKLSKKEHIQFIIATHSKEIVNQTEPRKIIIIDNENKKGKRLSSAPEIIDLLEKLGSIDHIDLALLLQTKKCLFVEGNDFKILQQFANTLKIGAFQGNGQVVPIKRGGGENYRYYDDLTIFRNFIGNNLRGYSIIDRDHKPDDLVTEIITQSQRKQVKTHVWNLCELENYLLKPKIIERVVNRKINPTGKPILDIKELIIESANEMKDDVLDSIANTLVQWTRHKGKNIEVPAANKQAREVIASNWDDWDKLIAIIPGKKILRKIRAKIQKKNII